VIKLTRFGGQPFYLNDDLIESVESTPDTTLQLTTGKRVIVQESPEEVLRRIVAFRQRVYRAAGETTEPAESGGPD
jgi:flagellar protein FlbD